MVAMPERANKKKHKSERLKKKIKVDSNEKNAQHSVNREHISIHYIYLNNHFNMCRERLERCPCVHKTEGRHTHTTCQKVKMISRMRNEGKKNATNVNLSTPSQCLTKIFLLIVLNSE